MLGSGQIFTKHSKYVRFVEVGTFSIDFFASPFLGGFGAPFGLPFWSILEALGALLRPRGCPKVVDGKQLNS